MVNKIVKAKQYAENPERATFHEFTVSFEGDNDRHEVRFREGAWQCSCDFFSTWQICCHTMAMERLLEPMIKVKQSLPELAAV
jgi:hypothetical protein